MNTDTSNSGFNSHHSDLDGQIGLIFCCPFTQDNSVTNCPLYAIRLQLKTLKEKFNFWKNLPVEAKEKIVEQHHRCTCPITNDHCSLI